MLYASCSSVILLASAAIQTRNPAVCVALGINLFIFLTFLEDWIANWNNDHIRPA